MDKLLSAPKQKFLAVPYLNWEALLKIIFSLPNSTICLIKDYK
jgi:hypothetical protein